VIPGPDELWRQRLNLIDRAVATGARVPCAVLVGCSEDPPKDASDLVAMLLPRSFHLLKYKAAFDEAAIDSLVEKIRSAVVALRAGALASGEIARVSDAVLEKRRPSRWCADLGAAGSLGPGRSLMAAQNPPIGGSSPGGRIVTFYSYKGGTGRSMALANAAWILASQGMKVLVVDWDLEAPGLHRYFHPFLEDPELSSSAGLIEYFYDVVSAALSPQGLSAGDAAMEKGPWWCEWTSLLRYSYPLDTSVLASDGRQDVVAGSIDFIPAGRQTTDYGERVASFDWKSFYDRLGGGVLLEAVKQRMRERYDYILIDSRTGVSDISGICTVQMPDDLVVCFNLNQQSMQGAAAVARSASVQRTRSDGIVGLRIWPVPTRIESAEKERLDAARTRARALFWEHLGPLLAARDDRAVYWGRVEVPYQPFYAYEEVLAVFAERKYQSASMLSAFEYLVNRLTGGRVTEFRRLPEPVRQSMVRKYLSDSGAVPLDQLSSEHVYLSSSAGTEKQATLVKRVLADEGISAWLASTDVQPGDDLDAALRGALSRQV